MRRTLLIDATNAKDLSLMPCTYLHGVGKQMAGLLARLNIHCIQDLLFHLPINYQDRSHLTKVRQATVGSHVMIEGKVASVHFPKGGRTQLLCRFADGTGHVHLRFFYIAPIQRQLFQVGQSLWCFGEIRLGPAGLEMVHPEYHVLTGNDRPSLTQELTPIYSTTAGLSQTLWRKITKQALQLLAEGAVLQDVLPKTIAGEFLALSEALHYLHRPPVDAKIDLLLNGGHAAQKRLAFEELLAHRLSLLSLKQVLEIQRAAPLCKNEALHQTFLNQLSFQLTDAQVRALTEIFHDLSKPQPMLRLVQGDVGSGKTVVAALCMLQAVMSGHQAALLAPTELLAEQHFRSFQQWFDPFNISVTLLTGQIKKTVKQTSVENIANGAIQIVIGTHAILQKNIQFADLVLIVIDEQHRFGVQQRAFLREKGMQGPFCPHQLIMTATPIPRTLAMGIYADLDCSTIDELPKGRTPIVTKVIDNARRPEMIDRTLAACLSGRQAYWVCALITESETLQCETAEQTLAYLRVAMPQLTIGLLHGQMKPAEKITVMNGFKEGHIQLLVATTVIEVGVDVPNASLMIIENAERFGLAALHQLRGRVGRGAVASHCILMYQSPLSAHARDRLSVLRDTTDGFKIAQRDLELRGPGEVLGTKQTGDLPLRIADMMRDQEILIKVQHAADVLTQQFPKLIQPLIQRWMGQKANYSQV